MDAYVITDGNRFMYENCQGKYVPAHSFDMADTYTKEKATIILNNYIPKTIRKIFRVEKIETVEYTDDKMDKSDNNENNIVCVSPVMKKDLDRNEIKTSKLEEVKLLIEKVKDIDEFFKYAEERKEFLSIELSKIDREINDWMHYMEFKSFNACQGYIAAKSVAECRKKRRVIKDEMQVIKEIEKTTSGINLENIVNVVKAMDNRVYKPKENKNLFAM